jgi:uncharacterized protein (DUF2225 family)
MLKIDSLKVAFDSGEIKVLPSYSFPGCYPLFYITSFSNILCPTCANKIINDEYEHITHYDVNWESLLICDRCSIVIESAYGGD